MINNLFKSFFRLFIFLLFKFFISIRHHHSLPMGCAHTHTHTHARFSISTEISWYHTWAIKQPSDWNTDATKASALIAVAVNGRTPKWAPRLAALLECHPSFSLRSPPFGRLTLWGPARPTFSLAPHHLPESD